MFECDAGPGRVESVRVGAEQVCECTPGQSQTNNCYGNATTSQPPTHPPTPQPKLLSVSVSASASFPHLRPACDPLASTSLLFFSPVACPCARHTRRNPPPSQPGQEDLRRLLFASLRIGGETSLFPPGFPVC